MIEKGLILTGNDADLLDRALSEVKIKVYEESEPRLDDTQALDALASDLKSKVGKLVRSPSGFLHIMDAREAQRVYFDAVRKVMSDGAFQESHDGRTVRVKCQGCGKIEMLAAKITRYRCRCDPHVERFTFKDILGVDPSSTAP